MAHPAAVTRVWADASLSPARVSPHEVKLSEKEALREVYHSRFYQKLTNPKTALVTESRDSQVYLYMQQRAA